MSQIKKEYLHLIEIILLDFTEPIILTIIKILNCLAIIVENDLF